MSAPFADGAASLAETGFSVFRIRSGQKLPQDRWRNGTDTQRATNDPSEIARRARLTPGANIGIATGNGLAVLDIDTRHGGTRPAWAVSTREVSTPSGGAHCYYSTDGPVRNSAGRIAQGVDVRGDGGMVVAPPSCTADGSYQWTTSPDAPMAFVPAWRFHTFVTPDGGVGVAHSTSRKRPEDVRRGEVHDQCLAWAAWLVLQGCDDDEVRSLVWEFVGRITFPVDNANGHIDSAVEWVLSKQREQEETLALTITPGGTA